MEKNQKTVEEKSGVVMVTLSESRLDDLFTRCFKIGCIGTLKSLGMYSDEKNRSELSRMYGKRRIDDLISSGRLQPVRVCSNGRALYSEMDYLKLDNYGIKI